MVKFIKKSVLLSLLLFLTISGIAQNQQKTDKTPVEKQNLNPKLRIGHLDNGLTYYIRHNETPKGKAEFYAVHNTGSMQEDNNQRGFAHFLGKLAFTKSINFPSKNGIKDYAEKTGMKTGENLNIRTGFDKSVYMLKNVSVTNKTVIDSCLLILHDWTSFLLLDEETVKNESALLIDEWEKRKTTEMRLWEQQLPKMYPNSKYGYRLPVGIPENIEYLNRNDLEKFYKKWFRTDLQAIIIVGDIDVNTVEEKVKKLFSNISAVEKPEPKELFIVQDNKIPLVSIAKDKEMTNMNLKIFYKHEKIPYSLKGTIADLITTYSQSILAEVMSERFSALSKKPNTPFISANAKDGDYFVSKTKGAWTTSCTVKPNELENALKALVRETERFKQFGISEQEFKQAKEKVLKSYEKLNNEKNKQNNSYFAEKYVNHFTNEDFIPEIEEEYEYIKQFSPDYPLDGINNFIKNIFKDNQNGFNTVVSLYGPDKENIIYPTEEELFALFIDAGNEIIGATDDEIISKVLVPVLPKPGSIISETQDELFGATYYKLSNGVSVIVKNTAFKQDQILMSAISPGGTTMFKDNKDIWNLKVINNAVKVGGLGDFNEDNLKKAIAGKRISFNMGLTPSEEVLNGDVSAAALKTLFELIYLQFYGIRSDNSAYTLFKERFSVQLNSERLNPDIVFSDTVTGVLYNHNQRTDRLKSTDLENADYKRMIEMYKERFADASDFVFTFVGDINTDSIRPLIEQYLATLPALNRKEKPDENQVTPFRKGKYKIHFPYKLEPPQSSIGLMYTGLMTYNLKNLIIAQQLNSILDLVFLDKVRTIERTTDNIFIRVDLYDFPKGRTSLQIYLQSKPENNDKVIEILKSELEKIANEGPSEFIFKRSFESNIKQQKEIIRNNDYWLNIISAYYSLHFDGHTDYEKTLQSVTKEDIQKFTKDLLNQGNEIEVVMYPE